MQLKKKPVQFANPIVAEDMAHIERGLGDLKKFEGANLLITGAAGFLGFYISHFLLHLIDRGVNVQSIILLDKFMLGRPSWIDDLAASCDRVKVFPFDIATGKIADVPGADGADFIIHMASIASPVFYRKFPLETLDANVGGLRNLLDFYRDKPLKGFLFYSSSEIYGDPTPDAIPTNEEYRGLVSCLGPRACYDEAKRFGETVCWVFATKYGTPVRMVRPFNNYGPGMGLGDKRAPADFAQCVLDNKDIVILSSGSPTRTFCYVADAVLGYFKVLLHDQFDVFNIGMDRPEISIVQLAESFQRAGKKLAGYPGKVVFQQSDDKEYLTNNPNRRCPDLSKARRLLGFNPAILVDDGVERFLRFYLWQKQNSASR